jgi:chaperonin GroEL
MQNAGLNADALLAQVESAKPGQGINVNDPSKGLVDLKSVGVVDPAAVTRQAIQNAVSIAATAMTMGALVVEVPEEESPTAGGGMPGGMGGMM